MGFRYRKSINLGGGFRINLSKSGVGYSWGTKGFRYTKTATGRTRTTYSIPGTGISHVTETSNKRKNNNQTTTYDSNTYDTQKIENSDISHFKSDEYSVFLQELEKILVLNYRTNLLLIFSFIFACGIPILWILFAISFALKLYLFNTARINLDYDMDDFSKEIFTKKQDAWIDLFKSNKIWRMTETSKVKNKKISAGVTNLIKRIEIKKIKKPPFYLKSNINIIRLKFGKENIYFLPDRVLIIKNRTAGAVAYDDITFEHKETRFIESNKVPSDAKIIDYTWQYVNKNGSPDKRYKNNKKLPICKYGEIHIKSNLGLNIVLLISDPARSSNLVDTINSTKK